jgi:hypothetical protein
MTQFINQLAVFHAIVILAHVHENKLVSSLLQLIVTSARMRDRTQLSAVHLTNV